MKRNLKKSILLVFILTMGIVSLTACNSSNANIKDTEGKASEKVKIEYWHVNADTQGGKTVKEIVDSFNKSQDKIEVVEKYNPDMYKGLMQNMQASIASGISPDIVQVGWAFLDYFSENFEYSEPQEIIDEFDKENSSFLTDNFLPNILNLAKNKEGKQVGIPYSLSSPVLYLNKDLLKEAGLDENGPATWEEIKNISKTIKEKTGKYGIYIQEPMDNWATQAVLESNGAKFITDGKASFASEEGKEAYRLWADMVLKDETALNIGWEEGVQSFIRGDVAMIYTTIAQRNNIQSNSNFEITAIESPSWEGKEARLPAGGAMLSITSADDEKKAASWEFIKYLYSVENMAKWTIGTGYVPPRKDVAESENGLKEFLEENTMMKPAIEQMDKVVPWVSFPGNSGLEAEQKLLDMRDQILTGKVEVDEAMDKTQEEINKLLD
ncbi:ABC transporter substrate-binding protein [Miniphocaeibacter halophilus]|uniref:ABC transporter substrate-binding protein n=1 Tax=Miniphocaeibacter halophilus TaxID=2931922 RepID=A0AC61MNV8_9FIRM|nr:ABC transporter substrate-binding protein [Miniphocaeibacter halophilus]QQK07192.1 ABC transporter substrate-binding protein [Miniphocaeibacter halophilus]